jgi:phospholipid N-methyltransferase
MTHAFNFFQQGVRNLRTMGTISRSSPFLCRKMAGMVDYEQARVVVELGAGDGVITHHLLSHLHPDGKLLAFEVLPQLSKQLQLIDDPRLITVEDSAERLLFYLEKEGLEHVDFIVSAIPFVMLPQELSMAILNTCKQALRPGGLFIQVYYSLLAKKFYDKVFGNVKIHFVALNIPPAFVLVSERT